MARQIKETPILKGKDAKRFDEAVKANEHKKVPLSDYKRAIKNYEKIKLI
ncbi:MAG: hypothetical protein ACE5FU_12050 [Nitrospinota bacterium]